jgi:hypothetical protein
VPVLVALACSRPDLTALEHEFDRRRFRMASGEAPGRTTRPTPKIRPRRSGRSRRWAKIRPRQSRRSRRRAKIGPRGSRPSRTTPKIRPPP